jgi:hypothetical protein
MPLVAATRAKCGPNLQSLSRMRYFGMYPYGVASRSGTRHSGIRRKSRHIHMDDLPPTQKTFLEREKAETNALLDSNDQTKSQLNFSFIKIGRTAESQWILNRSDGTFLPRALTSKLVQ